MVLVASYICGPLIDPDLWWHITIGRWIVAHVAVPQTELWNYFAIGNPWVAYSWLFEVLVAVIDRYFQIEGLLTFKFFLTLVLIGSLAWVYSKTAKDGTVGLLLGVLAGSACFSHLTLRPQLVVWSLFVWLLYYCQTTSRPLINRDRLAMLLILCLWSNLHLTQALGLVTILFWTYSSQHKGNVMLLVLWGLLGSLMTPYLGLEWAVFFSKTGHPLQYASISEFQPLNILHYSTAFLVLGLVLLITLMAERPRLLSFPQYVLICAFTLASLAVAKFLPFAIILICFVVARIWPEVRLSKNNVPEGIRRLTNLIQNIPEQGLAFVFLVLAFLNLHTVWNQPLATATVPRAAVDFMQTHKLSHPWLHEFGQGGYVMYRLSDAKGTLSQPVMIDGRTNVNPDFIWNAYQAALTGQANWSDFLNLTKPETILWRRGSPFVTLLVLTKEWCIAYASGKGLEDQVVLIKTAAQQSVLCQEFTE